MAKKIHAMENHVQSWIKSVFHDHASLILPHSSPLRDVEDL